MGKRRYEDLKFAPGCNITFDDVGTVIHPCDSAEAGRNLMGQAAIGLDEVVFNSSDIDPAVPPGFVEVATGVDHGTVLTR